MKLRRQAKIIELIEKYEIDTQEELTSMLNTHGFDTTQATISRDIKELHLAKISTKNGNFKYVLSGNLEESNFSTRLQNIFKECVVKIDTAQNIIVVKTLPGLGSAAAAAIDSLKSEDIVGSLAGDDTVFIAMKTVDNANDFSILAKKMLY